MTSTGVTVGLDLPGVDVAARWLGIDMRNAWMQRALRIMEAEGCRHRNKGLSDE